MRLYYSVGPNSRVVRMFADELGLALETEILVLSSGDGLRPQHLARNPLGQVPVLETDEGGHVSETTAICEYLAETRPGPPLIGTTPAERAECRMWTRRVDLAICQPLVLSLRFGPAGFRRAREPHPVLPARDALRAMVQRNLAWLDGQLADREWLCGARFTLADIQLFAFIEHGIAFGELPDPGWSALARWLERIGARPSAERSAGVAVDPGALSGTV